MEQSMVGCWIRQSCSLEYALGIVHQ